MSEKVKEWRKKFREWQKLTGQTYTAEPYWKSLRIVKNSKVIAQYEGSMILEDDVEGNLTVYLWEKR